MTISIWHLHSPATTTHSNGTVAAEKADEKIAAVEKVPRIS